MTFKSAFLAAALVSGAFAHAASGDEDDKNAKKIHYVWPVLVTENWVPEYKINKAGFLAPVEAKPYETPPAALAFRKGKDDFERLNLASNYLARMLTVTGPVLELGTVETETPPEAPAGGGNGGKKKAAATKPKESFKPYLDEKLPGFKSVLCLYPKHKNDWRSLGRLSVPLDEIKAGDSRALVMNVSGVPVTVRTAAGNPATVPAGGAAFIPCVKTASGIPLQAVALRNGKQEVVANTAMEPEPGLLVLTFLNADPKSLGVSVTFFKSHIDPASVTAATSPDGAASGK